MRGRFEGSGGSLTRGAGQAGCAPVLVAAALCLLLTVGLALPALADPFAEVPARHWSFDALGLLVPPGLVGSQALAAYHARPGVMRFEVALLVAQALRTAAEQAGTPDGVTGGTRALTAGETQSLRRLTAEFAPELEVLGVEVGPLAAASLALPAPAPGPFVDLDALARSPETVPAASGPASTAAMAAVSSPAGVLAGVAGRTSEQAALASAGGSGAPPLPETSLSRDGLQGPFPSQVKGERQLKLVSVPIAKPVLAVSAAVQGPEARLPVPNLNLSLTPTVMVSGSLTSPTEARPGSGAVQVEAKVAVAGVEVGANVKNVQAVRAGVDPALEQALRVGVVPESEGYGLSLRLGQVALTTGFSRVKQDQAAAETHRSVEVGYRLNENATVRAGYGLVDADKIAGVRARTDASVGVNVNLAPGASVTAGVTLEGMKSAWPTTAAPDGQRANAGVELRLPWNAFLTAGYEFYRPSVETTTARPQSAATLGVGLDFAANGTLLVGYRLIDFWSTSAAPDQERQHNLTAGVSMSF